MKFLARLSLIIILTATVTGISVHAAEPSPETVLETMKKASDFMANTVSNRGGYVYIYSADLTRQWGEIPARPTQIWTQPPGTPTVGLMYLRAWQVTGEEIFLEYAEMAADALAAGQHRAGGWNYLIDFDMPGIEEWYETSASRNWGFEEYYHYYGNCTFDDDATYEPANFLLQLYHATTGMEFLRPLQKSLEFVLEAQYPNGAWPQRYPLKYDYPHDGHPDYTHYYTFNDGVIHNNIMLLMDAWNKLGDERYREAAVRGMYFYITSQLPKPQGGWAQQYTMDMKPGAARTYEPAAVSVHSTLSNIRDLYTFYGMTGDRRFLRPIPDAIDWLERSVLSTDPSDDYTHAGFYEPGVNLPLYYHFEGAGPEDHEYEINHEREGAWWYRKSATVNIGRLRDEYERHSAMSPGEATAAYELRRKREQQPERPSPGEVAEIIDALDSRGAWVTREAIRDTRNGMLSDAPAENIQAISIRVFLNNMNTLVDYLAVSKEN
ncbi:MAG: pectate lyase [Candidatus Latescibacterota bacterium]